MSQTSFYSEAELAELGLGSYGKDVLISRKASIYSPGNIRVGDHVRVDDFCILSGTITLGSYIHISAQCCLYGGMGIRMEDFSGLSPRTIVLSSSDDFGGDYLIGPMIPNEFTNVTGGLVHLEKYVQIGAGSVIFPNLTIHEGTVVGAMSLVNKELPAWSVFAGIPAIFIKERNRALLLKAAKLLSP